MKRVFTDVVFSGDGGYYRGHYRDKRAVLVFQEVSEMWQTQPLEGDRLQRMWNGTAAA